MRLPQAQFAALEVTPEDVQLDPVMVGEARTFEITLKNVSEDLVEFAPVMVGCACLDVRVADARLQPGESTSLSGTLRARGRSGTFRDELLVLLTRPRNDGYRIPIEWQVKSRFEVSCESVTLRPDLASFVADTATVRVRNASDMPLDLSAAKTVPVGVNVQIESNRLMPGQTNVIRLSADPTLVTPTKFSLTFPCSHPSERALQLDVDVNPVGGIEVMPAAINLGVVSKQELLAHTFTLTLAGELLVPCDVQEVNGPRYLYCKDEPRAPAPTIREFTFHVRDNFGAMADLAGEIAITYRHPASGHLFKVKVPLSGFLLDGPTTGRS